jgi:hypothetical protein
MVITRLSFSLDYCHLDNSIVAGVDGLVCLPSVDVNQLYLAVFGAHQYNIGLDDGSNQRTNHRIVLDYSLEEHGLDQSARSTHNLPYI